LIANRHRHLVALLGLGLALELQVFRRIIEEGKLHIRYEDEIPVALCFHTGLVSASGHMLFCLLDREQRGKRPWNVSRFYNAYQLREHNQSLGISAQLPERPHWFTQGIAASVFDRSLVKPLTSAAIEHMIERSDRLPEQYLRLDTALLVDRYGAAAAAAAESTTNQQRKQYKHGAIGVELLLTPLILADW
jgi:hypothetical protein